MKCLAHIFFRNWLFSQQIQNEKYTQKTTDVLIWSETQFLADCKAKEQNCKFFLNPIGASYPPMVAFHQTIKNNLTNLMTCKIQESPVENESNNEPPTKKRKIEKSSN